jgi:hypothetical protein
MMAEESLERNQKVTYGKTNKSQEPFSMIHAALPEDRKLKKLSQNLHLRRTMSS